MMQRLLLGLGLVMAALVVADRVTRTDPQRVVASTMSASTPVDTQTTTSRSAAITIVPDIAAPSAGTPSIDLRARLAIRQRIDREGTRVYLDSMLANTDSTVVRWSDDHLLEIPIAFVADTTVEDFERAALDDARSALRAWSGNGAGIALREVGDSSALIVVRWVRYLDAAQTGITEVEWAQDGTIRSAKITLALRQGRDSTLIPAYGRRRIALHEIGHALGLPHSARDEDAMFPSSPQNAPSSRDQATLQLLYAVPTGPVRTP